LKLPYKIEGHKEEKKRYMKKNETENSVVLSVKKDI